MLPYKLKLLELVPVNVLIRFVGTEDTKFLFFKVKAIGKVKAFKLDSP